MQLLLADDLSPADIGAAARHVAHALPETTSHR